jgi:hypothetical protein
MKQSKTQFKIELMPLNALHPSIANHILYTKHHETTIHIYDGLQLSKRDWKMSLILWGGGGDYNLLGICHVLANAS